MNSTAVKRIISDLRILMNNPLESEGIFIAPNEDNIFNLKALIIGPKDTPYADGFYLFDLTYPENYPFSPPKVKFRTTHSGVRFNPNLYEEGKVCLSIINTWSGPAWTSAQTTSSVLLSILSLLTEHPLENEPGYEGYAFSKYSQMYNIITEYNKYRIAVNYIYNHLPKDFIDFKDVISGYILKNHKLYSKNLRFLATNVKKQTIEFGIYNLRTLIDYKNVSRGFENLIKKLKKENKTSKLINLEENNNEFLISEKRKYKKRRPDQDPKLYTNGYIIVSSNDSQKYKIGLSKTGRKVWIKLNT